MPAASNGTSTAYYDVSATFGFGLTLDLPPLSPVSKTIVAMSSTSRRTA